MTRAVPIPHSERNKTIMEEKQTAPALTLEPDLSVPAVPTLTLDPEPAPPAPVSYTQLTRPTIRRV